MPMTTLLRAMLRDLRAIVTTSANRSIRSTVRTTSAVSEDAVLPWAAIATPTAAAASAGASLMPSPTMTVGPRSASSMDDVDLLARVGLGMHRIDTDQPAHRLCGVRPVTGRPARPARAQLPAACAACGGHPGATGRSNSRARRRNLVHTHEDGQGDPPGSPVVQPDAATDRRRRDTPSRAGRPRTIGRRPCRPRRSRGALGRPRARPAPGRAGGVVDDGAGEHVG